MILNNSNLIYAKNSAGKLVHVKSVPNGNGCGCFCPECNKPLCAKNEGIYREPHFAHIKDSDCDEDVKCAGGVETVLHLMAKEVIKEIKQIRLPKELDSDSSDLLVFDRIDIEVKDVNTGRKPDAIGYYEGGCVWIEFKKWHGVDGSKRNDIYSSNVDCVEVDLKDLQQNIDEIKRFLVESDKNRVWHNNDNYYKWVINQEKKKGKNLEVVTLNDCKNCDVYKTDYRDKCLKCRFKSYKNKGVEYYVCDVDKREDRLDFIEKLRLQNPEPSGIDVSHHNSYVPTPYIRKPKYPVTESNIVREDNANNDSRIVYDKDERLCYNCQNYLDWRSKKDELIAYCGSPTASKMPNPFGSPYRATRCLASKLKE